jgi:DNA-binding CsgD family transcriptional regulator
VEGHVGHLLAKLGVSSRTAAISSAIVRELIDPSALHRS